MTSEGKIPASESDKEGARSTLPGMPLSWRLAILGVVVVQFLFVHGAVWKRRFDWDRSILYSYATIPFLVLAALLIRRRWSVVAWFAHTVEIASAKFAITATVLLTLLVVSRNEIVQPAPSAAISPEVRPAQPPPIPTVIDPATTGQLTGRVTDASGNPLPGAIVYVASGLEHFVFAVPDSVIHVENDGTGFQPALSAARTRQTVIARSTNGQLHTLLLEARAGSWVRNIPLLASGAEAHLPSDDMRGVFSLRCAVHGASEKKGHLALFPHPFFAVVPEDGRFRFAGVPAGNLSVAAFLPDRASDPIAVNVRAGQATSVALSLVGR